MGEAFITRRGGGGAGASLEITGEAGSTVTIANTAIGKTFTKTLDAQGKALFKGLKSGTWNITMTDGTKIATGSIVIDNEYEEVISYWDGTLYNLGDEYTDITGGWQIYGTQIQKQANRIYIYAQEWQGGNLITTENPVDLTNYNTLHFYITDARQDGGDVYINRNKVTSYGDARSGAVASFNVTNRTLNEQTIDISSLTGSFYVSMGSRFWGESSGGSWNYMYVNHIWVTK